MNVTEQWKNMWWQPYIPPEQKNAHGIGLITVFCVSVGVRLAMQLQTSHIIYDAKDISTKQSWLKLNYN